MPADPALPLRLMISLLYLKHAFNESDEGVVERWAETPTWHYFSGQEYFEHCWPCDPSLLVRFRRSLGEEGVEQLLASTINVAVTLKLIATKQLATVIVDSTVMPKAIVGRLRREIQRKATQLSLAVREALGEALDKSGRILQQFDRWCTVI